MTDSELIFAELNAGQSCRSYLVASRSAGEAALVDPLLDRVPHYLADLERRGLKLALAIDTHTHADHFSGSRELARRTGAKTAGSPRGSVHLPLAEGDTLRLGDLTLRAWASPGHTRDSLVLLLPDRVLSADTLLIHTTGRTDLPSGDAAQEWESLQRLLTLPDETLVFPGHDYSGQASSTIGAERRGNSRLLLSREEFIAMMGAPRTSKPALLEQALAYNAAPLDPA